jgi:hypothetical protein
MKKLTPFDAECIRMIADITHVEPQVEQKDGRIYGCSYVGNRANRNNTGVAKRHYRAIGRTVEVTRNNRRPIDFYDCNDPEGETLPDMLGGDVIEIDPNAGTRYCRTLKEINAIQVDRDNVEELQRFTGGGSMTIPRIPGGIGIYSFISDNGLSIDVPETWYIIREDNGKFSKYPNRDFNKEFEPKEFERCENCETNVETEKMLHDREGVPLCPECVEALSGDPEFELVGVLKIKEERESQVYEHGYDVTHDRNNNKHGEIKQAVAAILNDDLDLFARTGWDYEFYHHIKAKPELEQLAICGALVAAEIDRLTTKK